MKNSCPVLPPIEISYTTSILSIVIGVLTVVGNGIIILVVIRDPLKKLHTPFNYFVVNLAVCDWVFGAISMPGSAYGHYQEAKGNLQGALRLVVRIPAFMCGCASMFSIVALAIDRYFAIVHAIKYRQCRSWIYCSAASGIIWILSIGVSLLYLTFPNYFNYQMFYAHATIIVALISVCVIYGKVISFLNRKTMEFSKTMGGTDSMHGRECQIRRLKNEKLVTRTLLIIIFAFIGIYIPAAIMIYILKFCTSCNCNFRHVLRDSRYLLMATNSCMNPFICTIRLKSYWNSIIAMFTKDQKTKRQDTDNNQTFELTKTSNIH